MTIHLYKTFTPSTLNEALDSQVKSNTQNNLIYGQHCYGKGCNARRIITAKDREGEYNLNRNACIYLIHYEDGEKRYILHTIGAIIKDTIIFGTS
ncbi:hypothetical protein Peur_015854 [Populus x canadensis]